MHVRFALNARKLAMEGDPAAIDKSDFEDMLTFATCMFSVFMTIKMMKYFILMKYFIFMVSSD